MIIAQDSCVDDSVKATKEQFLNVVSKIIQENLSPRQLQLCFSSIRHPIAIGEFLFAVVSLISSQDDQNKVVRKLFPMLYIAVEICPEAKNVIMKIIDSFERCIFDFSCTFPYSLEDVEEMSIYIYSIRQLRNLGFIRSYGSIDSKTMMFNLDSLLVYLQFNLKDEQTLSVEVSIISYFLRLQSISLFAELMNASPIYKDQKLKLHCDCPSDILAKLMVYDLDISKFPFRSFNDHKTFDAYINPLINDIFTDASNWICSSRFSFQSIYIFGSIFSTSRMTPWNPNSVINNTSKRNIYNLSRAILSDSGIILSGPVGCGKSFLIRDMARAFGQDETMIEISIDEQVDVKSLIGAYICSDIPGEFVWQNGIITEAVNKGYWVIIENIDKIPLDAMATLSSLLQYRRLNIHGQCIIDAHTNFRLFGVYSTSYGHQLGSSVDQTLSEFNIVDPNIPSLRHFVNYWYSVIIDPFTLTEIEELISVSFPVLTSAVTCQLMSIYSKINIFSVESESVENILDRSVLLNIRPFTLRDLMKVAKRISRSTISSTLNKHSDTLTIAQRQVCLLETIDIFAASIRDNKLLNHIVHYLGTCWDLSFQDIESMIINRQPQIMGSDQMPSESIPIVIGRISMSIKIEANQSMDYKRNNNYSFTKYASRILETIAAGVQNSESILLVGETGAGKTTCVQELARMMNVNLLVQNLSLSTDSSDLFGGFRPVTIRQLMHPIFSLFSDLFQETFSTSKNNQFAQVAATAFNLQQWRRLNRIFLKAAATALSMLEKSSKSTSSIMVRWRSFEEKVRRLDQRFSKLENGFAFSFVDGILVNAMRDGSWVLLDEINLASPETLQGLYGILDGQSYTITDKGDIQPIPRNPNFRIFAAMNPPTDVGKRELPLALRNRFTEIYVDEMLDKHDLCEVTKQYMSEVSDGIANKIVETYLGCRELSMRVLVDGAGQRPKFSLRSLTRSLRAAKHFFHNGFKPLNRAIFEGFILNFYTLVGSSDSREHLWEYLKSSLELSISQKELSMPVTRPKLKGKDSQSKYVLLKPFWLRCGPLEASDWSIKNDKGITRFVMTPTMGEYIRNVCAATSADVAPILLQGPTSVGKTTMIEYIAARTGHPCVRINNHEHTDIQEYIGGYATDFTGQLVFRDGLLVQALRKGYWIILDELNLAPSDVLEALNRLLDDNKELFISETGELIHPSEGFRLFATQNPPGVYGGRKPLSRAFRNRFIEIVVNDLPTIETEEILTNSCGIPPKFSHIMVSVMNELSTRRHHSSIFQGKHGAVTLRDLIKWGKRPLSNIQQLAEEGYMLLAEKLRSEDEKKELIEVLNKFCKFIVKPLLLYSSLEDDDLRELIIIQSKMKKDIVSVEGVRGVGITKTMARMWKLSSKGLKNNEPILLVGGVGTGKTTVAQILAASLNQKIRILNCHQSSETSDIIGGLRPVRNKHAIRVSLCETLRDTTAFLKKYDTLNDDNEISLNNVDASLPNSMLKECIDKILSQLKSVESSLQDIPAEPNTKRAKKNVSDDDQLSTIRYFCSRITELWTRVQCIFEWQDGPLVQAMKEGDIFVLDEINLAEDSVIERLNSVLESSRTITLAEKGGSSDSDEKVSAHPNFKFIATMNPGGDYGKRELSPALRSRFTEIWVPDISLQSDQEDILMIIKEILHLECTEVTYDEVAMQMINFMKLLNHTMQLSSTSLMNIQFSVRDVLAWTHFISKMSTKTALEVHLAIFHGAQMLILDGLGIGMSIERLLLQSIKRTCIEYLINQVPESQRVQFVEFSLSYKHEEHLVSNSSFGFRDFNIPVGPLSIPPTLNYIFDSDCTRENIYRIMRALQLQRPILLEGPPGVGKSSVVANLAAITGHKLVRINLSEHTEISDLFGADLPVSSSDASDVEAKFVWCDGIFLQAMKAGSWVLLDELNLAPQSVLEGLNACFDHRQEVFLPDIGQIVHRHSSFRVFCTQNPIEGGGGRKGLPQSFLSRFARVYVETITELDMLQITSSSIKRLEFDWLPFFENYIAKCVSFVYKLHESLILQGSFGVVGGPWEFNLRDLFRWIEMIGRMFHNINHLSQCEKKSLLPFILCESVYFIFVSRMRSLEDREFIKNMFFQIFEFELQWDPYHDISYKMISNSPTLVVGSALITSQLKNDLFFDHTISIDIAKSVKLKSALIGKNKKVFEYIALAVELNWPVLLVGTCGSGKRRLIRKLASMTGNNIVEFSVTSATDASELLGSFEQVTAYRYLRSMMSHLAYVNTDLINILFDAPNLRSSEGFINILRDVDQIVFSCRKLLLEESLVLQDGQVFFRNLDNFLRRIFSLSHLSLKESTLSHLEVIHKELEKCQMTLQADVGVAFQWTDGVVVKAMEQGNWLVLENINFCSASVLDRLNGLLEPNGNLVLTENGNDRVVFPHKNFRIFLTMNPHLGEISRAMRNRCAEIFTYVDNADVCKTVASVSRDDVLSRSHHFVDSTAKLLEITKILMKTDNNSFSLSTIYSRMLNYSSLNNYNFEIGSNNVIFKLHQEIGGDSVAGFQIIQLISRNPSMFKDFFLDLDINDSYICDNWFRLRSLIIQELYRLAFLKRDTTSGLIIGIVLDSLGDLSMSLTSQKWKAIIDVLRIVSSFCDLTHLSHASSSASMSLYKTVIANSSLSSSDIFEKCKTCLKVIEVIFFKRWIQLFHEERIASRETDCAYLLMENLGKHKVLAITSEEKLLYSMFHLIQGIDTWTNIIVQQLQFVESLNTKFFEDALPQIDSLLCLRDCLVADMISSSAQVKYGIPLNKFVVIISRMKKLFSKFDGKTWDFQEIFQHVHRFELTVMDSYNHPFSSFEMPKLRKQCGTECTPRTLADWTILSQIEQLLKDLLKRMIDGASFVEQIVEPTRYFCDHSLLECNYSLALNESIGLLSTFQYLKTSESKLYTKDIPNADVTTEIVNKLRERSDSAISPRTCISFEMNLSEELDSAFDGELGNRIDIELDLFSDSVIAVTSELIVLRLLVALHDLISRVASKAIFHSHERSPFSISDCKLMGKLCKLILQTASHCLFPIRVFHKIQSLCWGLEALGSSEKDEDDWKPLISLLRNYTTSLAVDISELVSSNHFNHIDQLIYSLKSPSISLFMNKKKLENVESISKTSLSASFAGVSRLDQSVSVESLFKLIDLKFLFPGWSICGLLADRASNTINLTIMAMPKFREVALRLVSERLLLSQTHSICELSQSRDKESFIGLLLMDMVFCCESLFCDSFSQITEVYCRYQRGEISSMELFALWKQLGICTKLSQGLVRDLFETYMDKCLDVLSCQLVNDSLARSKLYCYTGLMYFTMLLPCHPMDPMDVIKEKLAINSIFIKDTDDFILAKKFMAEMSDAGLNLDLVHMFESCSIENKRYNSKLLKKLIERPDCDNNFSNLFYELIEISKTLLSKERVDALMSSFIEPNVRTNDGNVEAVYQQEALWQHSILSFINRLNSEYKVFIDIWCPIVAAIVTISKGVRMLYSSSISNYEEVSIFNATSLVARPSTFLVLVKNVMQYPILQTINVESIESIKLHTFHPIRSLVELAEVVLSSNKKETILKLEPSTVYVILMTLLLKINYLAQLQVSSPSEFGDMVNRIFHFFSERFTIVLEEKKLKELAAASTYQSKSTEEVFESNEVKEEDEMLQSYFPNHLQAFAHLTINEDTDETTEIVSTSIKSSGIDDSQFFDDSTVIRLVSIHFRWIFLNYAQQYKIDGTMFARDYQSSSLDLKTLIELQMQKQQMLIGKVLEESFCNINKTFEDSLLGFSISSIRSMGYSNSSVVPKRKEEVESIDKDFLELMFADIDDTQKTVLHDFQSDANVSEVQSVSAPIRQMLQRTSEILKLYPGNEMLLQVAKISILILEMHVTSPMGKILVSIELLLQKAQEWESFATHSVSLNESIQQLRGIIAKWRELELKSWSELLRSKEKRSILNASQSWFHLYSVVLSRPMVSNSSISQIFSLAPWLKHKLQGMSSTSADVVELNNFMLESEYLENMFQSLDDFIRSSSVGEFAVKLHFLRLFGCQLVVLSKQLNDSELIRHTRVRLARVVLGIWRYYDQFLPFIRHWQESNKTPLQQRLVDEIKMSKWDNFNVFGLVEHSERIHRKLTRLIKKYEVDVLNVPVESIFRNVLLGDLADTQIEGNIASDVIPSFPSMFPLLQMKSNPLVLEDSIDFSSESLEEEEKEESVASEEDKEHPDVLATNETIIDILINNVSELTTLTSEDYRIIDIPTSSRLTQLPSLNRKMKTFMKDLLAANSSSMQESIRFGTSGAQLAEDICKNIFSRITHLRVSNANKAMKKRAFMDLLNLFEDQGFSKYRSHIPVELKSLSHLFAGCPAPVCNEVAFDFTWNTATQHSKNLEKAEIYFNRNVAELNQLRNEITLGTAVRELSLREVQTIVGIGENVFLEDLRLRATLSQAMEDYKVLVRNLNEFSILTSPQVKELSSFLSYALCALRVLESTVSQSLKLKEAAEIAMKLSTEFDDKGKSMISNLFQLLQNIVKITEDLSSQQSQSVSEEVPALCGLLRLQSPNTCHVQFESLQHIHRDLQAANALISEVQEPLSKLITFDVTDNLMRQIKEITSSFVSFMEMPKEENDPKRQHSKGSELYDSVCVGIDQCLIAFQKLRSLATMNDQSESEIHLDIFGRMLRSPLSKSIYESNVGSVIATMCLQFGELNKNLDNVLELLRANSFSLPSKVSFVMRNAYLVFKNLLFTSASIIEDMMLLHKSTSKLLYIYLRVGRTVLLKGFCSALASEGDEGGGESGGEGKFQVDEGTGLGEGDGKKDVSDEIDNEEQMLGTKDNIANDPPENEKKSLDKNEVDNGVEMSTDFEGNVFDLPEDEEREEDHDEDDSELKDRDELEREMGDADLEDVVDEKQWNSDNDDDEDGNEEDEEEEKFEKDSPMKGKATDEMRTKDSDDKNDDLDNDDDNSTDDGDNDVDSNDSNSELNEDKDDKYMEKSLDKRKKEVDDTKQDNSEEEVEDESDSVDATSEVDMDEDKLPNIEEEIDDAMDEQSVSSNAESTNEEDMNIDQSNENITNEEDKEDDGNEDSDGDSTNENDKENSEVNADATDPLNPNEKLTNSMDSKYSKAYGVTAQDDSAAEQILGNEENDEAEDLNDNDEGGESADGRGQNDSSRDQSVSVGNGQGDGKSTSRNQSDLENEGKNSPNDDKLNQSNNKESLPNPFKQKGDIMKKWHRRLNILDNDMEAKEDPEQLTSDQENSNADSKEIVGGLFEHLPSSNEANTEQILADTSVAELIDMNQDSADDTKKQTEDLNTSLMEEQDIRDNDAVKRDKKRKRNDGNDEDQETGQLENKISDQGDATNSNPIQDINTNEMDSEDDVELNEMAPNPRREVVTNMIPFDGRMEDISEDPFEEQNIELKSKSLIDLKTAREMWSQHRLATELHSSRLCEQLRLVLAPTLAVRLQGDYRTGKRINMRKVIPFIASGFRKDKIWLRRTKPAKREYKVLLLVDNSKSMRGAGSLTLSAISTISMAMSRLEVGDLCVSSFSDHVKVIHPFGQPFDNESGVKLFSHFNFDDDQTLLGRALGSVSEIFSTNDSSRSSQNDDTTILKLCFIISDARIDSDSRVSLAKTLRELQEKHILVVLLLIDMNQDPKDSIFNTRTVEFKGTKVITSNYLDNFPFPFYTAIQELDVLPELLSDALKQWFEAVVMSAQK